MKWRDRLIECVVMCFQYNQCIHAVWPLLITLSTQSIILSNRVRKGTSSKQIIQGGVSPIPFVLQQMSSGRSKGQGSKVNGQACW